MTSAKEKKKTEYRYLRVIVTYSDGETSGNRVFKSRAKAETWAHSAREIPSRQEDHD